MKKFWEENSENFFALDGESRVFFLHPWLRNYIKKLNPNSILDYGSGEGDLFYKWNLNIKDIMLYDINENVLLKAKSLLANKNNVSTTSEKELLPKNYFDIVVCSLVLMTIESEQELIDACKTMYSCGGDKSRCIVSITHPCFRQYGFSTFKTDLNDHNFNYLSEGDQFTVTLTDKYNSNTISFTDNHWSLSKTINIFLQVGFNLKCFFELPDKAFNPEIENTKFPGYIVLDFQKK